MIGCVLVSGNLIKLILHSANVSIANVCQAGLLFSFKTNGLYYKPMMIVNDDSRVVNKLETSLTDDARAVICDRHMSIVLRSLPQWKELSGAPLEVRLYTD
jgi:hypothetical protein